MSLLCIRGGREGRGGAWNNSDGRGEGDGGSKKKATHGGDFFSVLQGEKEQKKKAPSIT